MSDINDKSLEEDFHLTGNYVPDETTFFRDIPTNDGEDIIKKNIERANDMLDRVEEEMDRGNFSPRMVEVFSKLIDNVTTAATQIQSSTYNNDYLILRQKLAELKELEVKAKVKSLTSGNNQKIGSQNIILSDRESILKMIRGD